MSYQSFVTGRCFASTDTDASLLAFVTYPRPQVSRGFWLLWLLALVAFVASVAFCFHGFRGLWSSWLLWLLAFLASVASVAFVAFGFRCSRGFWLFATSPSLEECEVQGTSPTPPPATKSIF